MATELIDWGVSGFRERDIEKLLNAVERRMQNLVLTYQPEVLALEQVSELRLSASMFLGAIEERICSKGENAGLQVHRSGVDGVKKQLCGAERVSLTEMADVLIELYPHLEQYRNRSKHWQDEYWRSMFSAVGVGLACVRDISSLSSAPHHAECAMPDSSVRTEGTGHSRP